MKKLFTLITIVSFCFNSYAQTMQASIGTGSQPNRVKIYLRSTTTLTAHISTLQFNIGIPTSTTTTPPTMTVTSAAFGISWTVSSAYSDGGFWNYNLITSNNFTNNFTANIEQEAMEVNFTNGVPNSGSVSLVTLNGGGISPNNALFFCSGDIFSNGMSNLYYTRSGVTVDNKDSYTAAQTAATGASAGTSSATISSIILPVKFLSFTAAKKDNSAILNWQIEDESALTDHYEVERSLTGTGFESAIAIPAKNNGKSANTYTFTDANLSSLHSTGVVYYRVKQIDKDGRAVYTEIKKVHIDGKALSASIYPNPVKGNATLSINLVNSAPFTISISDASGKKVQYIQMEGLKGLNTKLVDFSALATGSYRVQVQSSTETITLPVVKGN